MFGIITLLCQAHVQEPILPDTLVTDAEQQFNNDNKNGCNGNVSDKGQEQGKNTPQSNDQKNEPNAGKNGQQNKGNVKWEKYKEEHNVILRPEVGITSINLDSEENNLSGVSFGLSIGKVKTKRLKAANVGVYNRSRVYGSVGMGSSLNTYDLRMGSVIGVKVLHAEVEAGLDL